MVEIWTKEGKQTFDSIEDVPSNLKLHRDGAPAIIEYAKNGKVTFEYWYKNGLRHRDNGPAYIEYYPNGKKYIESWYQDGKYHRDDGPAIIEYNNNGLVTCEIWIKNGVGHRDDGPAEIWYFSNGKPRKKIWFQNGIKHRDDGPAIIEYNNNDLVTGEIWVKNGVWHRDDGPAVINYDSKGNIDSVVFFIDSKKLKFKDWIKKVNANTEIISPEELDSFKGSKDTTFFNEKDQYAIVKKGSKLTVYAVDSKVFESKDKIFESFEEYYERQTMNETFENIFEDHLEVGAKVRLADGAEGTIQSWSNDENVYYVKLNDSDEVVKVTNDEIEEI